MATKKKLSAIEQIEKHENQSATAEPELKAKRTFRSAEVRLAEIDKKIAFHQKAVEQLEAKKSKIGTARRVRKMSYAKVFAELKSSGKTPEEIAAFLNS